MIIAIANTITPHRCTATQTQTHIRRIPPHNHNTHSLSTLSLLGQASSQCSMACLMIAIVDVCCIVALRFNGMTISAPDKKSLHLHGISPLAHSVMDAIVLVTCCVVTHLVGIWQHKLLATLGESTLIEDRATLLAQVALYPALCTHKHAC
jgi:hypothetical protein